MLTMTGITITGRCLARSRECTTLPAAKASNTIGNTRCESSIVVIAVQKQTSDRIHQQTTLMFFRMFTMAKPCGFQVPNWVLLCYFQLPTHHLLCGLTKRTFRKCDPHLVHQQ